MELNDRIGLNTLLPTAPSLTFSQKIKNPMALGSKNHRAFVGVTGFEPATTRPPGVYATGLRYTPICFRE